MTTGNGNHDRRVRFGIGQLVATPGALRALMDVGVSPLPYLARHARGDWGDLTASDKRANDRALTTGARIISAYQVTPTTRIWIITEAADELGARIATTVLLPEEY